MRYTMALLALVAGSFALEAAIAAAADAKYDLRIRKDATDLVRVSAQLDVTGSLKSRASDHEKLSILSVSAQMDYDERSLAAQADHRLGVRHYRRADATIRVEQGQFQPRLKPGNELLAVSVTGERATIFSPAKPLTREELDLVDIPGNTAVLPLLLPREALAVGGTWKPDADVLAMLLGIDAVGASDVQCVLWQVSPERVATVDLAGHVDGAVNGVATEIQLKGRFEYDIAPQRFTKLELTINEDRPISHVGPGLKVTCQLKVAIEALGSSLPLSPDRCARIAESKKPDDSLLLFHAQKQGYQLRHSRLWHVVDEKPTLVVLRLIERGELIAQCNISPGNISPGNPSPTQDNAEKPADQKPPEKPNTIAEYREHVKKALDKNFRRFVTSKEGTTSAGLKSFCVIAEGEVQELPVRWVYYLLSEKGGRHAALVFTMEQKLAETFGTAGEKLVEGFKFDAVANPSTVPAKQSAQAAPSREPPRVKR
jgi:hypothetical protein